MILWLLLGLLLAPTLFAVLSRAIARSGNRRGAAFVAAVGFAGCIACVLALRWLPLNAQALGPLQILVPSTDIVIARESFLDTQAAGARSGEQVSNGGDLRSPSDALASPSLPEPRATSSPPATPEPTVTNEPTAVPTGLPEPTPEPTAEPEPTDNPAGPTSQREPRPAPTEPPPEPAEEPEPEPAAEPQRYVVEPGDTLRGIAALYDVDAAELQLYNGLSDAEADSLQVGQVLFIPPSR